jgi:uncharacterized protein with PIN domain
MRCATATASARIQPSHHWMYPLSCNFARHCTASASSWTFISGGLRPLRMLGFDAWHETGCNDQELSRISARKNCILLTRDCGLLKRGELIFGYFVRASEPRQQLLEVLRRFKLFRAAAPFQRCLRCNDLLRSVSEESIRDRLPPRTVQYYHQFQLCPGCHRVYWAAGNRLNSVEISGITGSIRCFCGMSGSLKAVQTRTQIRQRKITPPPIPRSKET